MSTITLQFNASDIVLLYDSALSSHLNVTYRNSSKRVNMLQIGDEKPVYIKQGMTLTRLLWSVRSKGRVYYYIDPVEHFCRCARASRLSDKARDFSTSPRFVEWKSMKERILAKIGGKKPTSDVAVDASRRLKTAYSALRRNSGRYFIDVSDSERVSDNDLISVVQDASLNNSVVDESLNFYSEMKGRWGDSEDLEP